MKSEARIIRVGCIESAIIIIVLLAIMYLVYGGVLPIFFGDVHAEWVRCPVTDAATITVKKDKSFETSKRIIEVIKCDAPGPSLLPWKVSDKFNQMANEYPRLTIGDVIACEAKWTTVANLPLQLWERGHSTSPIINPDTCRPPSRLWLK